MKRRGKEDSADGDKRVKRNSSISQSKEDMAQEGSSSHTTPGTTQPRDDNPAVRPSLARDRTKDSNDTMEDVTHEPSTCFLCKNKITHGGKDEEMRIAIKKDDVQAAVHWLAMGASVTGTWHHRFSRSVFPVMIASEHNSARVLRILLQHGADVNESDGDSYTPLMVACRYNSVAVARVLLQREVEVNRSRCNGTALTIASIYASVDMVKMLIEHGAKVNDKNLSVPPSLFCAQRTNRVGVMKILLEHGAEVDAEDGGQNTALMHACNAMPSRLDVVTCLVEHGAYVNHINMQGKTPLIVASDRNHLDIMAYLIEHGADVHCADDSGRTALMRASWERRANAAAWLLQHGADVDAVDNAGRTSLMYVSERSLQVTRLLLAHGADVHHSSKDGWTALLRAALLENPRIMRELLRHGATLRHGGENALGRVVVHSLSCRNVSTLRLILRECHWGLAARSGYWLQKAVEKRDSRACRLLAAAALVGRIG